MPLLPLLLTLLAAHPTSLSATRVRVAEDRRALELAIECEARTLCEALPIDADGDARLDSAELAAAQGAVGEYVRAHYRVQPVELQLGRPEADRAGAPLELELASLAELPRASQLGPDPAQWIAIGLRARSPVELHALRIEFALFLETNPAHIDTGEVAFPGQAPLLWRFNAENAAFTFADEHARRPRVLLQFLDEGWHHILTGYDHLCFVAALLVASRRLRALLGTITAFTLAHSLTLGLSAFDVLNLSPTLVEPVIAFSIAYVAALNLWQKQRRGLWAEAFGFGLIHGLGFASLLRERIEQEPQKLSALLGFNAGVELGQLAVVACGCALVALLKPWIARTAASAEPRLVPRRIELPVSALVLLAGTYLFVERLTTLGS